MSIEQFVDSIFNKICVFTGVKFLSQKDREDSAAELIEMLLRNYPDKYLNEVVGSYFLADKKRLFDENERLIELFRMVDYRQCSDLLNAFDKYFKKQFESEMKSQKFYFEREEDKKPTKEDIQELFLRSFEKALEIVKNGNDYNLAGTDLFIYSELKERGIIELSQEEMKTEIDLALIVYKKNLIIEKADPKTKLLRKHDLARLIESILPDDVRVINLAKRKILNDYLKSFVLSELTVKEILK